MSVKKRALIVTAALVVLLAASVAVIFYGRFSAAPAKYAYIYQNNELIETINLSVEEPYQFCIDAPEGGYNIIEVRDGGIGVVEASCPDKLCQNMGFIRSPLLPVVCLPNHLVITVESEDAENSDLDGIVY